MTNVILIVINKKQINQMQQPQPCSKCQKIPQDILMLSCGHDLCLNCAGERLNVEMKKKRPADSIVCQLCNERTPLDAQSISELEKFIPVTPQRTIGRPLESAKTRAQDSQYRPVARDVTASGVTTQLMSGISSKKTCGQHIDEDILYFCFTCKCECICPECVIHGKHKDHEVKTIKKSHPIIKSELQSTLDRIESSIENLLIRKNEVEKNLRILNEQNSNAKRQIQQAFEEVRSKLEIQERDLLARCDSQLFQAMEELEKSTKNIVKRIEELRSYSTATVEFIKKDEQTMLNFYAKKWKEISEECKQQSVYVPSLSLPSNQVVLGSILDLVDSVEKIGALTASRKR